MEVGIGRGDVGLQRIDNVNISVCMPINVTTTTVANWGIMPHTVEVPFVTTKVT